MTVSAPPARRVGVVAAVAALAVAIDQLTKSWAVRTLADRDIDLVWTLRLHLEHNSGSAFSLNQGRGGLVAVGALVLVAVVLWVGHTTSTTIGAVAVGLVLGGALGNVVDRLLCEGTGSFLGGSVIDFIDPQWWPVFNVADISITFGAILLFAGSFLAEDAKETDPS